MFVDNDEVVVLIDDTQFGMCQLAVATSGRDGYNISGVEHEIMACLYGVAYLHTALAEELFD